MLAGLIYHQEEEISLERNELFAVRSALHAQPFGEIWLLAARENSTALDASAPSPNAISAPLVARVGDAGLRSAIDTYHDNILTYGC